LSLKLNTIVTVYKHIKSNMHSWQLTISEWHDRYCQRTMRLQWNFSWYKAFFSWQFGKLGANCIITDLSACGCSILVPKHRNIPSGLFCLLIMSPIYIDQVHTVLQAEQSWLDKHHCSSYKKISLEFIHLDNAQAREINALEKYFPSSDNTTINCRLIKR